MAFYPGRAASITIGGTAKPIDTLEFKPLADVVDTTNFTSSGWETNEMGVKHVEISASGPYNGLASGGTATDAVGTSVAFVFDAGDGAKTVTARLSETPIVSEVRGVARISYKATSNGTPTITY